MVCQLLKKVNKRKSIANIYCEKSANSRELNLQRNKLIKPTANKKNKIRQLVLEWNRQYKAKSVYDVIDIAYHYKGTGSLGLERYILTVQKKSNQKFKLIDLKTAIPSCVLPDMKMKQADWKIKQSEL